MKRRCLGLPDQPCTNLTTTSRCPRCARRWAYPPSERQRMNAMVAAHIAAHGYICPGYQRDAHPSRDLTADHQQPRSRGGIGGPLSVLCRACNAARGARG